MKTIFSLLVVCVIVNPWFAIAGDAGVVQLLLGNAQVERGGKLLPLSKGEKVQVGDKLSTGGGGLLQLKMSDDALISLRANSSLHIECYEQLCLKLNLLYGEVRQVTGSLGQTHKDRFRLNTPVAAIGVRGTDFITRSNADDTWVRVLDGAIVAAPFGDGCSSQGLGICSTHQSALLAAQDPFVLHLKPNSAPVAIPGDAGLQAKQTTSHDTPSIANVVGRSAGDDVFMILRDHPEVVRRYLALMQYPVSVDTLPSTPLPTVPSQGLAFATWTAYADGMAQPYPQASQGREVTVGDSQYALWRETGRYMPPKGSLNYQLTQSQAQLTTNQGSVTPVMLQGGQLAINFDARQLSTQVQAQLPGASSMTISASGRMSRDDGLFALPTEQGGRIAGAISNDGRQVGYLINQPTTAGELKALTSWQMR